MSATDIATPKPPAANGLGSPSGSGEVTAWHRIISDQCRANRGDINMLVPLANELQEKLLAALDGYPAGNGTKFHLKLIIQIQ